jgi:hypothetical protein
MLYTYYTVLHTKQTLLLGPNLRYKDDIFSFQTDLFISNYLWFRLSPSISVYRRLNLFYSILDQAKRYYLYLSISLPSLKARDVKEWRNILRTKPEEGSFGMYLLIQPFPTLQGYRN